MNIFLGLIGVHEFFSFNFPLREYFFGTSAAPPRPISFLMVRPLSTVFHIQDPLFDIHVKGSSARWGE